MELGDNTEAHANVHRKSTRLARGPLSSKDYQRNLRVRLTTSAVVRDYVSLAGFGILKDLIRNSANVSVSLLQKACTQANPWDITECTAQILANTQIPEEEQRGLENARLKTGAKSLLTATIPVSLPATKINARPPHGVLQASDYQPQNPVWLLLVRAQEVMEDKSSVSVCLTRAMLAVEIRFPNNLCATGKPDGTVTMEQCGRQGDWQLWAVDLDLKGFGSGVMLRNAASGTCLRGADTVSMQPCANANNDNYLLWHPTLQISYEQLNRAAPKCLSSDGRQSGSPVMRFGNCDAKSPGYYPKHMCMLLANREYEDCKYECRTEHN
ncbi:hypothetical protein HDU86_008493, partial [Geranomyces michiganensis]